MWKRLQLRETRSVAVRSGTHGKKAGTHEKRGQCECAMGPPAPRPGAGTPAGSTHPSLLWKFVGDSLVQSCVGGKQKKQAFSFGIQKIT